MSRRTLGAAKPLEGPEAEAYKVYCWEHYQQALDAAHHAARAWAYTDAQFLAVLPVLLDKLARPEVFLREAWDGLPADEKAKYSPPLADEIAKAEEEAKKAWEARRQPQT